MRKVKLEPEGLKVESFAPVAERGHGRAGTVFGRDDENTWQTCMRTACGTCWTECHCPTAAYPELPGC